jgi:hypothetical protein
MRHPFILAILILSVIFVGCKKEGGYTAPSIKTLSAIALPDGSVLVTSEITDPGSAAIGEIGFCMDTTAVPDMQQHLMRGLNFKGNVFSANYKSMQVYRNHYFTACVKTEKGIIYGNTIYLDTVTVTCDPPVNSGYLAKDASDFYSLPKVKTEWEWQMGWSIESWSYSDVVDYNRFATITFREIPKAGAYTTTINGPGPSEVCIRLPDHYTVAQPDQAVYVTQPDEHTLELLICNATFNMDNGWGPEDERKMAARIRVPL